MLRFSLDIPADRPVRILCLGCHCDDIEIGCGGTILHLLETNPNVHITWAVFSSNEVRAPEAQSCAERFLAKAAGHDIRIFGFDDGYFPYNGAEIKRTFETLKPVQPDLIFTHFRHDLHQDHRLLCELTWNTFRNHTILEYEIPKFDGDLQQPNLFVHLDEAICQQKYALMHESFVSQREKHWFTEDTFLALLRLRGIESVSPTRYAEGFHCRKGVLK